MNTRKLRNTSGRSVNRRTGATNSSHAGLRPTPRTTCRPNSTNLLRGHLHGGPTPIKADDDEPVLWEFRGCGHATTGERLLVLTAALSGRQRRQAARDALTDTPPPEASP